MVDKTMKENKQYEPIIKNTTIRILIAIVLLGVSIWIYSDDQVINTYFASGICLLISSLSVWLTDKYHHKYPQRYYSYLIASHLKSMFIMLFLILPIIIINYPFGINLLKILLLFAFLDILPSIPCRRVPTDTEHVDNSDINTLKNEHAETIKINKECLIKYMDSITNDNLRSALVELKSKYVEFSNEGMVNFASIDNESIESEKLKSDPVAFLLLTDSINELKRLNLSLQYVTHNVCMGGYFAFRYTPLEVVLNNINENYQGISRTFAYMQSLIFARAIPKLPIIEKLYFSRYLSWLDNWLYPIMKKNRRVISRAEMWGRMYYQGFEVLDEIKLGNEYVVLTRRHQPPELERKPSFYLVVGLTKVGLNGNLIKLHKLRSMYPFSEFIQEKIFRDQGLTSTGKFKDDFRLTDYGKFIRKYWLDEIPQIFDWLHGEIKLVGMRATSPHYLSLYPKELYDLYIQTKPGLIPPIFDAKTDGFDDIVRIEMEYLEAYQNKPILTDVRYFIKTFHDIFVRGVRSK